MMKLKSCLKTTKALKLVDDFTEEAPDATLAGVMSLKKRKSRRNAFWSLFSEILHQFMSFCRLQTTLQLHHYSHCHMLYYYTQAL